MAVKVNSGITSITQLNGKNVATTTGAASAQTLRRNERAKGIDFKEIHGKDHADSFLLLESGRADAFVMDGAILAGNIANAKSPADFKIVGAKNNKVGLPASESARAAWATPDDKPMEDYAKK